jgi:hypothetical protein
MACEIYTQGLIFCDGVLAAEEVSFNVDYSTNDNVVVTQSKGFAGITPGAGSTKVSIETAIPRAGYEIDYFQKAVGRTPVEVIGFRGSKKINLKGFIQSIGEKHGVNTTSMGNIEIVCGEPTFS